MEALEKAPRGTVVVLRVESQSAVARLPVTAAWLVGKSCLVLFGAVLLALGALCKALGALHEPLNASGRAALEALEGCHD